MLFYGDLEWKNISRKKLYKDVLSENIDWLTVERP